MQLRIFHQRSEYNYEGDEYYKNKTTIALLDWYSMSFIGIESKVLYIFLSIKLHIGKYMDKGHYVCDVLEYNTVTWWNCYDVKITQYPVYSMNVYYELLFDKKKTNSKIVCMNGSYRIVSMLYIKKDILVSIS